MTMLIIDQSEKIAISKKGKQEASNILVSVTYLCIMYDFEYSSHALDYQITVQ